MKTRKTDKTSPQITSCDRWKLVARFEGDTLKLKGEELEPKEQTQQLVDEKRKAKDSGGE